MSDFVYGDVLFYAPEDTPGTVVKYTFIKYTPGGAFLLMDTGSYRWITRSELGELTTDISAARIKGLSILVERNKWKIYNLYKDIDFLEGKIRLAEKAIEEA